jgi:hypothetical protein
MDRAEVDTQEMEYAPTPHCAVRNMVIVKNTAKSEKNIIGAIVTLQEKFDLMELLCEHRHHHFPANSTPLQNVSNICSTS